MDISKAKGTIIMFEIVHSEDPYIPDKIALSKTFALTRKNSRFIEAVVALDSNYGQDFENVEPDVKYDPEKNASNAQGMRCGSTKYWFTEMQKPGADFRKCVLGAVIAIDSTNSTHLEACVNGRLEMRDRICRLCENCDSLKQKLKEEYNTSDGSGLIYVLTNAIQAKKEGETRRNLSFATKFCSYAAKFLETGTSFSKYDKVVSEALPLYAEIYLERKYKKNVFKIENEVDKKLSDEGKLKYRLDVYEKYMNVIKEILGKIPEEEISLDEFDHIVWYSLKGK